MSLLNNLNTRLNYYGGSANGRLQKGKLNSMKSALQNSYQSEVITLPDGKTQYKGLINQDKLKNDYDDKILSIDFDSGINPGDTFYWNRTKTHWIVYLRQLAEDAYFRGEIRRCKYQLKVNDTDYWVYVRGPVETIIQWGQKSGLTYNNLNYSLVMYITKNEETLEFFKRFKIIEFQGKSWEIQVQDSISTDGVIELNMNEYYNNSMEDDMIKPEIIVPDEDSIHIEGPQFCKPYDEISYSIVNLDDNNGWWTIDNNKVAKIISSDGKNIEIEILTGRSGSFNVKYTTSYGAEYIMPVTIESF